MLKDGINGFCMALADSVPGVSGGTVAFIMGFYDSFISSIHDLTFGKIREKKNCRKISGKTGNRLGNWNGYGCSASDCII